jgi:hypothetical protein
VSENPRARGHVHPVCLGHVHYIGVARLMGSLEISKPAAVLLAINEGLYRLNAISEADYKLLDARYRRPLRDVIAERQGKKEPSHVPVLTIENMKAKQRQHVDYSSLTLEQLQDRYNKAQGRCDYVEIQLLVFEARKRGVKLEREEGAI